MSWIALAGYTASNLILLAGLGWLIYTNIRKVKALDIFIRKWSPDGTHFCKNCSHNIGLRRDGKDILDTRFVSRREVIDLPDNVIQFKANQNHKEDWGS